MQLTPLRVSLIHQTKTVLIDGMSTLRWKNVLPGERLLSVELRVSRWTLRAALAELAEAGFIEIKHGLPIKIVPRKFKLGDYQASPLRVALVTPAPLSKLRLFVVLWVDELRTILHENGISLSILDSVKVYRSNPERSLKSLIGSNPHSAWILLLSTQSMQEWFSAATLPALIAGSRYENVRLPAIDIDCYAAGVHAGLMVRGMGHQKIGLLAPRETTAGIQAGEMGIRASLKTKTHETSDLMVARYNNTQEDICRAVDRLIRRPDRPSVIIASRANAALTTFSHCCQHHLAIPGDISLLALEWEPFLDYATPVIAHYELSPKLFARRTARALRERLELARHAEASFLEPIFVRGGSLRPPRPSA